jgi:hypothetical protein
MCLSLIHASSSSTIIQILLMKENSNYHPDSEMAAPSVDVKVQETYDLAKELEQFQSTKAGVKGLLDSGITKIPKMFIHPKEDIPKPSDPATALEIPVIDLTSIDDKQRRLEAVEKVY